MAIRSANAMWCGGLQSGSGKIMLDHASVSFPYTFSSRFEESKGSNPEELIGGALAGCFSMALAHAMEQVGHIPREIHTTAKVSIDTVQRGYRIGRITLDTKVKVPEIDFKEFSDLAEETKKNCPVSQALQGVQIELTAELIGA